MRTSATDIVMVPLIDTTVSPSGVEHVVEHARAAHLTALPSVLWMVAHVPHTVTPMLTDTHSMLELPHSAHSCSLAQNEHDVQQRRLFKKRRVKNSGRTFGTTTNGRSNHNLSEWEMPTWIGTRLSGSSTSTLRADALNSKNKHLKLT